MIDLRLLGSFEITNAQRRPASSVLAQPKRAALLAYLAIDTPRGYHRRDKLVALFWPEADASHARHALSQAIHHLRTGLGPDLIVARGAEEVALCPTQLRCDVTDMRDCLASGRHEDALEIYRAQLLPGFHIDASVEFDEWLERERRTLHESAVAAALTLAARREHEGDGSGALIWARRAAALAPADEVCARQLIRLLIGEGSRAAACAEYERLAKQLRRDFDAEPSVETRELLDTRPVPRRPSDPSASPSPSSSAAAPTTTTTNVVDGARATRLRVAAATMLALGAVAVWWAARPSVVRGAPSLAIAPFSVASEDTALVRLGQSLVTTIGSSMDRVGEIRVVDGIATLSLARPKGRLLSAEDAIALARRLGAGSVVHGTLATQGSSVRADAVLIDLSAGDAAFARVSVTVRRDSLSALTDSLAWALLRAIWSHDAGAAPMVGAITTHNAAAMRSFLEGERLASRNSLREATEAYRRAIDADTTFAFAHYRYWIFCAWLGIRADSTIGARMLRHVSDLPERERALVNATRITTVSERIEAQRRITERYPTYAPAWAALGDYLMHVAIRTGHDSKESVAPWQQAVRLRPDDEVYADHLTYACLVTDDPCVRGAFAHYDSLVRANPATGSRNRGHRMLTQALAPPGTSFADSLIRLSVRDSILPIPYGPLRMLLMHAALQRPELIAEWDAMTDADERRRGLVITGARFVNRAIRGEWSAADSAIEVQHRLSTLDGVPLRAVRLRVIAELLGALPAAARTGNEAMALASSDPQPDFAPSRIVFGDGEAKAIVEATWIAGLNAMLRGDSMEFRQRLRALVADTSAAAAIAARSLRAIRLGRLGHRDAAADSLLALERQHGEHEPNVWGAFAADRLLAAQWLTEAKRYAAADSLLRFTAGFPLGGLAEAARAIFGPAMLQRSRIDEASGRPAEAVRDASLALIAYDRAPPSQQALVVEARSRVERLTAHTAVRR